MKMNTKRIKYIVMIIWVFLIAFVGQTKQVHAASVQGSVTVADVLGMDGASYIEWLESHEADNYYLRTPYCPGWKEGMNSDYRNPNGDCKGAYGEADKPGVAGMNCTGFVWHALYKPTLASGGNTSLIPSISGWVTFYRDYNVKRYYFSSKSEMLRSGVLEKGDIIWSFDGGSEWALSDVHHVGIFWGDTSSEDLFWHSAASDNTTNEGWNAITEIRSKVPTNLWVVVKAGGVSDGYAKLQKKSGDEEVTKQNTCYSLKDAVYGVYRDEACTELAGKLTTDASGSTNTLKLRKGRYWVREIETPKGYLMDKEIYPVTISAKETTVVAVEEHPAVMDMKLSLQKTDRETGTSTAQGAASLEHAEFTVRYYAGDYSEKEITEGKPGKDGVQMRTWVIETRADELEDGTTNYQALLEESYKLSGDEFYKDFSDGHVILPLGTITVQETKAPEGYLLDESVSRMHIFKEGDVVSVEGGNIQIRSDQVIRGDLSFVKKDQEKKTPMSGVAFKITSKTTGEYHIVVTDENGEFNSSSFYQKHSISTNENDDLKPEEYKSNIGIWFGRGEDGKNVPVDDEEGAFPYDTYIIEELECEANQGKTLIEPFEVTVSKKQYEIKLGTMDNEKIPTDMSEKEKPEQKEELVKTEVSGNSDGRPKTGDDTSVSYLIILLLISLSEIAGVFCKYNHKK